MLRIVRTRRTKDGVVITLFPVVDHTEIHNKLTKVGAKWSHTFIMVTKYDPITMECEVIFEKWRT